MVPQCQRENFCRFPCRQEASCDIRTLDAWAVARLARGGQFFRAVPEKLLMASIENNESVSVGCGNKRRSPLRGRKLFSLSYAIAVSLGFVGSQPENRRAGYVLPQ